MPVRPDALTYALILAIALMASACAQLPPSPTTEDLGNIGTIAVIVSTEIPASNIEAFATSHRQGLARGTVAGAGAGLFMAGGIATAGPLGMVLAPYVAAIGIPLAAGMGAIAGDLGATEETTAAELEALLARAFEQIEVQRTIAAHVITAGQVISGHPGFDLVMTPIVRPETSLESRGLVNQGFDATLEAKVTEIGFHSDGGKDPHIAFYMIAVASLSRTGDGRLLHTREVTYLGSPRHAKTWLANDFEPLRQEFDFAYTSMAEAIIDRIFLGTMLERDAGYHACGLAWEYPERKYRPTLSGDTAKWNEFADVGSLQPELRWETFPRHKDQRLGNFIAGVSHVTYDLRLWESTSELPPKLLHEISDHPTNHYRFDAALAPATRYFWSVRARFLQDGIPRATSWSYFRTPYYSVSAVGPIKPVSDVTGFVTTLLPVGGIMRDPCTLDFIPEANYYRFRTPDH